MGKPHGICKASIKRFTQKVLKFFISLTSIGKSILQPITNYDLDETAVNNSLVKTYPGRKQEGTNISGVDYFWMVSYLDFGGIYL